MIHKIEGNLLTDRRCEVICHQANCQNTMGSGIARSIREFYPEAYQADTDAYQAGEAYLGNISIAEIGNTGRSAQTVINLYGQDLYGTNSRKTNYEAVYSGLELVRTYMDAFGHWHRPMIGFPKFMGCKLGGGNWRIYETMIEEAFKDFAGEVYIVELKQ